MPPTILHQDDWLLALDKPAGMAVHSGAGIQSGTVNDWVRDYLGPRAWRNGFGASVAHRLDRETSGVLLVALRRPAMRALSEAFEKRLVRKQYLALVRGTVSSGRSEARLEEQTAATRWEPLETFPTATLLSVSPETGRKHQIRKHLDGVGHPLAGDEAYGDATFNGRAQREWGLQRLFLHASQLEFAHPQDGRPTKIAAPLPAELLAVLDVLRRRTPQT